MTHPPAAKSGTPAPGEVGREALAALSEAATPGPWEFGTAPHPDSDETPAEYVVNALTHNGPLWTTWAHDGSTDVDYVIPALTGDGPTSEANAAFIAAAVNYLRASLLSASPASETPTVLRQADDGSFYYGPASETPGPGEDDLRGERLRDEEARRHLEWERRLTAERDAAVEQRIVAEQKVARVEALCDEAEVSDGPYSRILHINQVRAALADPEADR